MPNVKDSQLGANADHQDNHPAQLDHPAQLVHPVKMANLVILVVLASQDNLDNPQVAHNKAMAVKAAHQANLVHLDKMVNLVSLVEMDNPANLDNSNLQVHPVLLEIKEMLDNLDNPVNLDSLAILDKVSHFAFLDWTEFSGFSKLEKPEKSRF